MPGGAVVRASSSVRPVVADGEAAHGLRRHRPALVAVAVAAGSVAALARADVDARCRRTRRAPKTSDEHGGEAGELGDGVHR